MIIVVKIAEMITCYTKQALVISTGQVLECLQGVWAIHVFDEIDFSILLAGQILYQAGVTAGTHFQNLETLSNLVTNL